jgi:hypothetical protein
MPVVLPVAASDETQCSGTAHQQTSIAQSHYAWYILSRSMTEEGQVQEVQVYCHRCHNPGCRCRSFTLFPPGLLSYSRLKAEVHLLALQMYAWGFSTYRRTATALGVSSMTAYRWVSAFGQQLLPVAALFGVVRCSGVVGVDEKWVQVPKNDKEPGPQRK